MKQFVFFTLIFGLFFSSCGNGRRKNQTLGEEAFNGYQQIIEMNSVRADSSARDSVDLGRLKQGEVVEYRLGIRNSDTTALVILEILNGCGCTVLEYDKQPLQPGDTASVTLFYDSKGQIGSQLKLIQIITSFSRRPYNVMLYADVHK